jgi:type IV secretion system protein VirB4
MALQFRRYAGAQVFAFDFGGSIRAAALAMGGDWHDLGGDLTESVDSVSLQPLARIHDARTRLGRRLDRRDPDPRRRRDHPEVKEHIWSALTSLASAPVEERTITGLPSCSSPTTSSRRCDLLRGRPLWAAARRRGRASRLGTVQAFETEGLIGTGAAPAVLAYLFHRIGDGSTARRRCSSSTRAGSRSTTKASPASSANG